MISGWLDSLGLGGTEPNWWQGMVRAAIVYFVALLLVRAGEKRALGKNTALDVVVAVMLGSVISRGINTADVAPSLLGAGVLVLLHWLLSMLTFRSDRLGTLLKGSPRTLVEDGEIDWDAMRKSHISREDLLESLRARSQLEAVEHVKVARLERSGDISAIEKKETRPRILEVDVAEGVQTVRIVIDG